MAHRNNHTRALHEVISIEAWHSSIDEDGAHSLHVDVSLRESQVGEDAETKVRFNLGLRRAQISFIIPDNEDIRVIQTSVAREKSATGTLEITSTNDNSAEGKVAGALKVNSNPSASGEVSGAAAFRASQSEKITLKSEACEIGWKQYKDADGNYTWDICSPQKGTMSGKPWDPVEHPRLKFRTGRHNLPPTSRIVAKCRRDDLVITNIEPKDPRKIKNLNALWSKNKLAAAEAVLKSLLERGDLDHGDVSEKFSHILLGETLVAEEVR